MGIVSLDNQVTYASLINCIRSAPKNRRRDQSAISDWMGWLKRAPEDAAAADLTDDNLGAYIAQHRQQVACGATSNRRSTMRSIQNICLRIQNELAGQISASGMTCLDAIDHVLGKTGLKRYAVVRRWPKLANLLGKRDVKFGPSEAARDSLTELEQFAEVPSGFLTRFVAKPRSKVTLVADFSDHVDAFREHSEQQKKWPHYAAKLDSPELAHLQKDVDRFCAHMSHPEGGVRIKRNTCWTTNAYGDCASLTRFKRHFARVAGWAMLPPCTDPRFSGLGLRPDEVSFALLGSYDVTHRFRKFNSSRSALSSKSHSKYNLTGASLTIIPYMNQLTHPETGWLTQTESRWLPDLRKILPKLPQEEPEVPEEITAGYFATQFNKGKAWRKNVKPKFVKARDPRLTLEPFLSPASPMDTWITPLIYNMQKGLPAEHQSPSDRFFAERNLMMIVAFFAIPLRCVNWRLCEIGKNIYQGPDGLWRIRITKEALKNRSRLDDDYALRIPAWAQPYFQRYVTDVLPGIYNGTKRKQWLLPKEGERR